MNSPVFVCKIVKNFVMSIFLVAPSLLLAEPLLVSGFVEARYKQQFSTPDSDSWQLQIKWLAKEGKLVEAGETVAIFDSAAVESEVEAEEAKLRKTRAESQKKEQKLRLELLEAESLMRVAELELEKAVLEASIPETHLTKIVYEKNQLEKKKMTLALQDRKQAFTQKKVELSNQLDIAEIQILAASSELKRKQVMLAGLNQKAERMGTVVYVRHPWFGRNIRAGDTVQKNFTVLEIPDTSQLYIQGWLNEVDIARVKTGPVEIYIDALNQEKVKGVLRSVSQQGESRAAWGDASYHALEVEVDDPEFDVSKLLPGMSVMLKVPTSATRKGVRQG
ncbi:HlyD family secretion protein [Pseudoteredinibacter isoporae]|uniref:Biotin carboxyl carrier protein n=1 Tax=Pseudoteredinibacter isoporae TaxID=570281 RepID=A0A7X0JQU1_9GAMM|nr:HlyD family efflux transporter periplasmic adaptor subunit [Pseudoteredinibacter isoporae]MBB6520599.1 biotin carboxyl carrier protein [Pseudoteredinibacter isoporae]NHO86166.1 HlyD family efflux transporter periplasmic adaptor subunit [Pseudoteredinibacter isoporae]NIB25383.1 HlyD family efflux transporter periplasmic adaptor subunit [Pseudoteredinibacter isoporae]